MSLMVVRSCASAPMVSWSIEVGVRPPSASTVGLSMGLATGLSLHAAIARTLTASAIVEYRFIELSLDLESGVDRQEERAAGRIRRYVLKAADWLITEVGDLGIEPCILRPGLQVPSAQLDAGLRGATIEHRAGQVRRQQVAESELAKLHESAVLDINRFALREGKSTSGGSRGISEQRAVDRGSALRGRDVEIVVGQVHAQTAFPPIEQRGEAERTEIEIVVEAHRVVRSGVSDERQDAVGARAGGSGRVQRLAAVHSLEHRHQLPLLNESVSEAAAE